MSAFDPAPSMMVVFSFSTRTRLARPSMVRVTFSSLLPRSSDTAVPAVRTAMSSSMALRRSPKPGAFTGRNFISSSGAVHEHRFRQFVREGAVAPAFLLSDYSAGRRRATLVASLVEVETRLSDAAIEMFDKLVGSLFTRAKRGQERRYQATARDVGQLM